MYKAIKTFYYISLSLSYAKRRKLINYFTFSLNLHDVNIKNVVFVMKKKFILFNVDTKLLINDEIIIIYVFIMLMIKNMSQQADNENFLRYTTTYDCKSCYYFKTEKTNMNFDIIKQERYH